MANMKFLLKANFAVTNAPISVPNACAKKGIKKLMGVNKCIDALMLSKVATTAPLGNGMI